MRPAANVPNSLHSFDRGSQRPANYEEVIATVVAGRRVRRKELALEPLGPASLLEGGGVDAPVSTDNPWAADGSEEQLKPLQKRNVPVR